MPHTFKQLAYPFYQLYLSINFKALRIVLQSLRIQLFNIISLVIWRPHIFQNFESLELINWKATFKNVKLVEEISNFSSIHKVAMVRWGRPLPVDPAWSCCASSLFFVGHPLPLNLSLFLSSFPILSLFFLN